MLVYQLRYPAEVQKRIRQQVRMAGEKLPPDLAKPPRLRDDLLIFLTAFYELTTDRPMAMSLGPIPWASIMRFADVYDFSSEMRHELLYCIRRMDEAYLGYIGGKSG